MSTGAIVAIILVPVGVLLLLGFALFMFGVLAARSARRSARASAVATATAASLTESYSTGNSLATVHYPPEFAAKSIDDATLVVSKNNLDGSDEIVQVAAVPDPISDDVNEFGRILVNAMKKNIEAAGDRWIETSRAHRACFKSYSGLAIEGTFTAKGITKEKVRICFFVDGNKGYELKSMVPEIHESEDLPMLQSIVDATELH